MTGRVCDKHQEYCPDGQCRWCEPEALRVCDDGTVLFRDDVRPPLVQGTRAEAFDGIWANLFENNR